MQIDFTYILRDRTDEVLRVTYTPVDGRLETFRKTLSAEYLTPSSTTEEIESFIRLRAPLYDWDLQMQEIDPVYRKEVQDGEARSLKMQNVITL